MSKAKFIVVKAFKVQVKAHYACLSCTYCINIMLMMWFKLINTVGRYSQKLRTLVKEEHEGEVLCRY